MFGLVHYFGERGGFSFIFYRSTSTFPIPLLIKLALCNVFLNCLSKSGANVFPWSIRQSLCICSDVFVTLTLYDNFMSGVIISPGLFFFVAVV